MAAENEIYAALADIFADVFMRDDITLTSTLTAKDVAGWDSFKHIEIIMATEAQFAIKFSTRELDNLLSVGDLVKVIHDKTAK